MGGGFSPEQEARLLPKVASGEYLGAFALSEAEAGSDVANLRCKAERNADGDWVINGTKMWCTYADQADYIILFARTSVEEKRHRGISVFLVEKERGTFPEGISGAPAKKIGYHGWKTWELSFDNFVLPADSLLGEEGRGFYQAVSGLEVGRAHTAARSIGSGAGGTRGLGEVPERAGTVRASVRRISSICGSRSRTWPRRSKRAGS
jgi:alkylation response protein AidB-like acyl-CoA dehydrogenase